jgi:hypothetical protein
MRRLDKKTSTKNWLHKLQSKPVLFLNVNQKPHPEEMQINLHLFPFVFVLAVLKFFAMLEFTMAMLHTAISTVHTRDHTMRPRMHHTMRTMMHQTVGTCQSCSSSH